EVDVVHPVGVDDVGVGVGEFLDVLGYGGDLGSRLPTETDDGGGALGLEGVDVALAPGLGHRVVGVAAPARVELGQVPVVVVDERQGEPGCAGLVVELGQVRGGPQRHVHIRGERHPPSVPGGGLLGGGGVDGVRPQRQVPGPVFGSYSHLVGGGWVQVGGHPAGGGCGNVGVDVAVNINFVGGHAGVVGGGGP